MIVLANCQKIIPSRSLPKRIKSCFEESRELRKSINFIRTNSWIDGEGFASTRLSWSSLVDAQSAKLQQDPFCTFKHLKIVRQDRVCLPQRHQLRSVSTRIPTCSPQ